MYGFYGQKHEYRINSGRLEKRKGKGAFVPASKSEARADVFAVYAEDQAGSKLERHPVTAGVIARVDETTGADE